MTLVEIQKSIAEAILRDDVGKLEMILGAIPSEEIQAVRSAKYRYQKGGAQNDETKVLIALLGEESVWDSADLTLSGLCQMLGRPKCWECILRWERLHGLRTDSNENDGSIESNR